MPDLSPWLQQSAVAREPHQVIRARKLETNRKMQIERRDRPRTDGLLVLLRRMRIPQEGRTVRRESSEEEGELALLVR